MRDSTRARGQRVPAWKVRSTMSPLRTFCSFMRTWAEPRAILMWVQSRTFISWPSSSMMIPFLTSPVLIKGVLVSGSVRLPRIYGRHVTDAGD